MKRSVLVAAVCAAVFVVSYAAADSVGTYVRRGGDTMNGPLKFLTSTAGNPAPVRLLDQQQICWYPNASSAQANATCLEMNGGTLLLGDGGSSATMRAQQFISTGSFSAAALDGGGNFVCPNNAGASSPCLSSPNTVLELGGLYSVSPQDQSSSVYLGALVNRDGGYILSVLNNYGQGGLEFNAFQVDYLGDALAGRDLYVNQAQSTDGRLINGKGPLYLIANQSGAPVPINVWSKGNGDVMTWFAGAGTQIGNLSSIGELTLLAGNGTAGSGTGITVVDTGAVRTFLHKITVANTALSAASTTDVTVWTVPAKTRVGRVVADVAPKFIGGALTAVTLKCGTSAGGTQYLLAGDVFTNAITLGDGQAELGASVLGGTGFTGDMTWGSTQIVSCRWTCTTANCSAATQGSATFYIEGVSYP